jgi:hypothetical protein
VRSRQKGVKIIGKVDCLAFLREFVEDSTSRLSADVRPYNRRLFVEIAMQGIQASLKASPSVKPWACLNQKKTDEVERLGDIDVLACSVDGTIVWVCEAKDLKLCRTLGEAALRLSDYRGQIRNNKPDKLLRHVRRVEYLRAHAALLGKRLRLVGTPAIHGIIIVNAPQPMEQLAYQYVHDSAVVMLDEVESVPWDTGW